MGKFGKRNQVSLNPLDYNISILGESGIGKTTLAKQMCEKLTSEEGYIHFDIGREAGADAIEGIISEKIEDWAKLTEVIDDITENKTTDYPDLKAIIWDTLDELIILAEAESIRKYNKKAAETKKEKVDTINAAWGGFGKGQDYATKLIIDAMAALRSVGISSIVIGHVKRTDIVDPITQETYSKLTADTTQRYFNAIKNKQHFVALAYIDREVVKEKTGRKNVATKEDIMINKAVSESRVISFRDDTYSVDSKSRFAEIVDRIPFDTDEFIKAMTDAIEAEKTKNGITMAQAKKEQAKRDKANAKIVEENIKAVKETKLSEEKEAKRIEYMNNIQANFSNADDEIKTKAKELLKKSGCKKFSDEELSIETLKEISDLF